MVTDRDLREVTIQMLDGTPEEHAASLELPPMTGADASPHISPPFYCGTPMARLATNRGEIRGLATSITPGGVSDQAS